MENIKRLDLHKRFSVKQTHTRRKSIPSYVVRSVLNVTLNKDKMPRHGSMLQSLLQV